jgi:CheY-like chemotaxis protein
MGNLQLLEYGAGLKGESQEFLWESLAAARRGADLTHRLLAFARNQPLRPQPLHVNAVIGGLKDMLERTLSAEIVLRYDLHEGRMVMADIQQLENAILNLAINARDAMVGGGTLTIRNSFRRLDGGELHLGESVEPGEYCDIEIRDTGTGMDGETLSKVFDPFFTTKEFGKGSGLGLSMVHGFVRQSNGYIDITSNLGAGTTVHLYLPLQTNETEVTVTEVTEGAWPNGAGEVVLVLEDEQDLRRTAANLLETLDYGALQASDAAEALALLDRGENVDLLFSDVVLPGGLTGPELYAKARLNYPDLKVLYCSGYTDNLPDRDDAAEGEVRLLTKPYSLQELAEAVHEALNSDQ